MRLVFFAIATLLAGRILAQTNNSLALAPLSLPGLGASKLTMPFPHFSPTASTTQRVAGTGCLSACSLPVKWLKLTGDRLNDSLCSVQWETTNEMNNLGFYVERSTGNTDNFHTVGFVAASPKADPVLHYDFPDANSYNGTTFYRLRQVDVNQQFSYSKTVAVKGYTRAEGLVVYPNPVQSTLQASVTATMAGMADFIILDANGKIILQRRQALQKGANLFRWETGMLANGTYLIQAILPGGKLAAAVFIKS